MAATKPYAHGTDVPVPKTRMEIETQLSRHGAHQYMTGTDSRAGVGFVAFTLQGRQYRITLQRHAAPGRKPEQVEREQWRALLLVIKAKLEICSRGDATPEREFMAHLVLPNGLTVGDWLGPQIADAYEGGRMPPLLPAGGP